jgi:hypothetical protein
LKLSLRGRPDEKVAGMSAQLLSEWGELVSIGEFGKPVTVPVGKYSIDEFTLRMVDEGGRLWNYRFAAERRFELDVSAGKETPIALLEDLAFRIVVSIPKKGASPGDEINVTPELKTRLGLELVDCRWGESSGPAVIGGGPEAEVKLHLADGSAADTAHCGFA